MNDRIFIFLCILLSCNNPVNIKTGTPVDSVSNNTEKIISDSLIDPNNYSYLADLPLRETAILILKDSIHPTDNKITFSCIDSISSGNLETRNFYFPVFLKILDKADGALSEAVGNYVLKYMDKYAKEFADRASSMTDAQFTRFASFAGYELYFEKENVKYALKWTKELLKNCADCDSFQLRQIDRFNKIAIQAVRDNNINGY